MATSQHAFQSTNEPASHFSQIKATKLTIDLEYVSVSQLLGRDYLFIDAKELKLPLKNSAATHNLLDDLIQQLGLAETHTVAVSVEETAAGVVNFTRHDLTWYKHKICKIDSISITHAEQHEFMEMIWRCSTSALIR